MKSGTHLELAVLKTDMVGAARRLERVEGKAAGLLPSTAARQSVQRPVPVQAREQRATAKSVGSADAL